MSVVDSQQGAIKAFFVDDVVVDPGDLSLRKGATTLRLEPKVMAVLVALSERPGATWTREELIERVWTHGHAGDESLTRSIYRVRKALSELGLERALTTVSRVGYRLNANTRFVNAASQLSLEEQDQPPQPFSLAVLPFAQAADEENQWLARGLVSDLSALLARIPRFTVAPVSSIIHLSDKRLSLPELADELHVRFVVDGSLARQDDTLRVRMSVLEAQSGTLLWARRYDTQLNQFYEVQDDAVLSIATAVSTQVRMPNAAVLQRHKRFNASAYERVQEAELLRQNYGRSTASQITRKLEEALDLEPDDAAVAAALAVQLSQNVVSCWADNPGAVRKKADSLIAQALATAPHDPDVLTAAGIVATMFHRPGNAIDYLEHSIYLNPNDPHALAMLGWQRCLRDADPGGITLIETAESRAPHHPRFALWATYRATAHLFMLEYEQGLAAARVAASRTPNYYQPLLHCAWACVGLGDDERAGRYVEEAHKLDAGVMPSYVEEMQNWSANSKHQTANHSVLQKLLHVDPQRSGC